MRKVILGFVLGSTLLATAPTHAMDAKEIVRRASPATALIVVETATGIGSGTGFVVNETGLVATNDHVIENALRIAVFLGGDAIDATVVGRDSAHDLAVLRLPRGKYPGIALGNSDRIQTGEAVFAIGYPLALTMAGRMTLEPTITQGIVSAVRNNGTQVQMSAAISPGNSGGPVFNDKGEVIGVARASLVDGQSLNFAVPVNLLKPLIRRAEQQREGTNAPAVAVKPPDLGSLSRAPALARGASLNAQVDWITGWMRRYATARDRYEPVIPSESSWGSAVQRDLPPDFYLAKDALQALHAELDATAPSLDGVLSLVRTRAASSILDARWSAALLEEGWYARAREEDRGARSQALARWTIATREFVAAASALRETVDGRAAKSAALKPAALTSWSLSTQVDLAEEFAAFVAKHGEEGTLAAFLWSRKRPELAKLACQRSENGAQIGNSERAACMMRLASFLVAEDPNSIPDLVSSAVQSSADAAADAWKVLEALSSSDNDSSQDLALAVFQVLEKHLTNEQILHNLTAIQEVHQRQGRLADAAALLQRRGLPLQAAALFLLDGNITSARQSLSTNVGSPPFRAEQQLAECLVIEHAIMLGVGGEVADLRRCMATALAEAALECSPFAPEVDPEILVAERVSDVSTWLDVGTITTAGQWLTTPEGLRWRKSAGQGDFDACLRPWYATTAYGLRGTEASVTLLSRAGTNAGEGLTSLRSTATSLFGNDAAVCQCAASVFDAGCGATSASRCLTDSTLELSSQPSAAKVIIDGTSRGVTPLSLRVPFGTRRVRVELASHVVFERTVELAPRRSEAVFARLEPLPRLEVVTDPPGARISVNGSDLGSAPLTIEPSPVGRVSITATLQGHESAKREIDVLPGQREKLALTLARTKGSLEVVPLWAGRHVGEALVLIDGKPASLSETVVTGNHVVEAFSAWGHTSDVVQVAEGDQKRITLAFPLLAPVSGVRFAPTIRAAAFDDARSSGVFALATGVETAYTIGRFGVVGEISNMRASRDAYVWNVSTARGSIELTMARYFAIRVGGGMCDATVKRSSTDSSFLAYRGPLASAGLSAQGSFRRRFLIAADLEVAKYWLGGLDANTATHVAGGIRLGLVLPPRAPSSGGHR